MKTSRNLKRLISILLMFTLLMSSFVQPISAAAMGMDSPVVNTDSVEEETDISTEETLSDELGQVEDSDLEQVEDSDLEQVGDSDLEQLAIIEPISPVADESNSEAKNWIEDHFVLITVGGKSYKSTDGPIPYQEGANISAMFEWKVADDQPIPKNYEYCLGDFKLKDEYKGGIIYSQSNRPVGEWTVVLSDTEDGEDKIVFTFEDWFLSDPLSRSFWVGLEGTVPIDPPGTGTGSQNRFQIGEEWFDMDLKYQGGEVDLTKEMKDCKLDADGNLIYNVTMTATVKGYIKDLILIDKLSNGIAAYFGLYRMDDLKVQLNEKELSKEADYTVDDYNLDSHRQDEPWGFELSFNNREFHPGDKITVTYTFIMDTSKFGNKDFLPDFNELDADGTDITTGDKITCIPKQAPFDLNDLKLNLKKEGDFDSNNLGQINWKLTIDTGVDAPKGTTAPTDSKLISAIKNAFRILLQKKYSDLNIKDILEEGHQFAGGWDESGNGKSDYFYGYILQNSNFIVNNGKWSIVYEYSTNITDTNSVQEFENTATLLDGDTTITTSGPVGVPAYTLDKSAIDAEPTVNPDGSVTMPWQIVTRIPGFKFDPFTIEDKPEGNNGYSHRYKDGSLKVYISDNPDSYNKNSQICDELTLPRWLTFTKTPDGGFRLTVTDGGGYYSKYLFFVYETEVVDAQGNVVDLTNANYQSFTSQDGYEWKNTTWIINKNPKDSDSYDYVPKEGITPTLVKGAITNEEDEATGDYVFTWLVRVNNIPVVTKNAGDWTESWSDIFSIDLEDTLPEGHVFENGTLVATLYKGSGSSTSSKNILDSDEEIPSISKWLSEGLQYEILPDAEGEQQKVKITWNTPGGSCPDLDELKTLYSSATSKENFYLALQYQSRLVDHSMLVYDKVTPSFENTAEGQVNGKDVEKATAKAQVRPGNFGAKDYDYQSDWVSTDYPGEEDWMYTVDKDGTSAPNMRFSIEINQPGLAASATDKGIVCLEDTMGSQLRLLVESVRLYNTDTKEYEDVPFTYDTAENKLMMEVPGGTHYTLTYWVEVCGEEGATISRNGYGNSVKLSMYGIEANYTKNPSGKKYVSSAGATVASTIIIQKVDAADTDVFVSGAEFTLEYGEFNDEGVFEIVKTYEDEGVIEPVSDSNGLYKYAFKTIKEDPSLGYVFRITEQKAPEDYLVGAPRYFVFTDYYTGDLNMLPAFVERRTFDDGNYSFPDDHIYANAVFEGTKQVNGREWVDTKDNGTYTFTLEALEGPESVTTGVPMPAITKVTNEGNVIRFPEIKYTEVGTYKYKITETAVDATKAPGVSSDPNPIYVTVNVVKDSKSLTGMTATVHYSRNNNDSFEAGEESFTFINSYKSKETTAELTVTKTLSNNGFGIKNDYTFDFVMTPNENNPAGDPVTGVITKSVTVSGPDWSGNTANFFAGLNFNKEGTYTYTLTEKPGTTNGVTYDETEYTVTVEITLNEADAKLESTVKIDGKESNNASFGNSYKAVETNAELTVTKTLNNNGFGIKNDYTFEFVLTPDVGNKEVGGDPVTKPITKSVTVNAPDWKGNTADFFAGLTFTKEGTYTYTLSEKLGTTNGVTYDETEYTVTVEITLNEEEAKLESTVKIDGKESNSASFGNSYKAVGTTAALTVTKTLSSNGFGIKNNYTFDFVMTPNENNPTGDPVTKPITKSVTVNGPDWKGSTADFFAGLTFTKEGTYTYTLTETTGSANGVTYDETEYTVTVEITLNEEEAKLESKVMVNGKESNDARFANSYAAKETTAALTVTKTLRNNGFGIKNDYTFEFVLTPDVGNKEVGGDPVTKPITKSVTLGAPDWKGSTADFFAGLTFTKEGTYTYTLTEKADGTTGVTYDETEYTVIVVITLNEEAAELESKVTVNGEVNDSTSFGNSYAAKEITAELTVTKTLSNNGFGIKNNYTFDFVMTPNENNPAGDPVTDAITKSVTLSGPDWSGNTTNFFAGLSFTHEGTYTYTLTETTGSASGVTYDGTEYIVTVEITLNEADAKLESTVKVDGEESNSASFGNTYKAMETTAELTVTKTLETNGFGIENSYTFDFVLTPNENNSASDPVTDAIIKSVTISGPDWSGNTTNFFENLSFTKEGTYTYTLTETAGSANGVTYDETEYIVTVEITLNEADAKLESTVKVDGEESNSASFGNSYKAQETNVVLEGKKTLVNGKLQENEFAFVLEAVTEAAPMPAVTEVTNGADGNFLFDAITYSNTGVYMYTITEKRGTATDIIYDETIFDVTVIVTLDEDNGKLVAAVTYQKRGGEQKDRAEFYNTKNNTSSSHKTGDNSHVGLWWMLLLGSIFAMVLTLKKRKDMYLSK